MGKVSFPLLRRRGRGESPGLDLFQTESEEPSMERTPSQGSFPQPSLWNWPCDDQTPVDLTPYYVTKHGKGGLSYWVGAARRIGPTVQDWEQRRKAPIVYLLKVGSDAIHERLYYVLARALNLPQQHVFWAVTPPHHDLIAVAIQFEQGAFFPKQIDIPTKTAWYRRKRFFVPNAEDFWRHEVLHYYCGTGDIHQAMIKGNVLFGIDAADCSFCVPFLHNCWQQYLDHYHTHDPARLPVLYEMMQRLAHHPELPKLVEQELLHAPGPVLQYLTRSHQTYSETLHEMHHELLRTLQR
jgi:hypothetical protein